ncbi:MAG: ribonuclease H-like domain-containing protein, partial [Syntrophales bacterium]|nr:ribonuclease H-like domain-containing protein [Syntrophales bacterium]
PGEEVRHAGGVCYAVRHIVSGSSRHGRRCVRDMTDLDMVLAAALADDPRLADLDWRDGLFLDTETTGLAGGTGTVAFLVGLAWFAGDSLVVHQLFARDYDEERTVLTTLADIVRERRFLVSFNGRAFDVGLLRTRYVMNRLADPLEALPHLDLLPPTRRLFGHRLESRSLSSLEEHILGIARGLDVPGWEVPQRYFQWLRHRDGRCLVAVFAHNRNDVLSLAALAASLTETLAPPRAGVLSHPGDHLSAGRLLIARDRHEEAAAHFERAAAQPRGDVAREARRELSLLYKRSGRWSEAVRIWEEMLRHDPDDLFALAELAKWCEHRAGSLDRALRYTCQALAVDGLGTEDRHAFTYRRDRITEKMNRRRGR